MRPRWPDLTDRQGGQPFLGTAERVQDRLNLPRLVGRCPGPEPVGHALHGRGGGGPGQRHVQLGVVRQPGTLPGRRVPAGNRRRERQVRSTAIGTETMTASPLTSSWSVRTGHRRGRVHGGSQRTGPAQPSTASRSRAASPMASCWLPPATRHDGLRSNPALTSASAPAGRWRVTPCVTSIRDTYAARAAGDRTSRRPPQPGTYPAGPGGRRRHELGAPRHRRMRRRRPAARLPLVIGHGRVGEPQPELAGHRAHEVVSVQHELGAALDDGARVTGHQFLRPHPAADPVPRLQDHHLVTGRATGPRPSAPRTRPRPPPPARSHLVIPGHGSGRPEPARRAQA